MEELKNRVNNKIEKMDQFIALGNCHKRISPLDVDMDIHNYKDNKYPSNLLVLSIPQIQ